MDWYCLGCNKLVQGEVERTAIYLTKGTDAYHALFWICKECNDRLGINEKKILCKITFLANCQEKRVVVLSNRLPNERCSICKGSCDHERDYGICIYQEKYNKKEALDVLDAVQVYNICSICYEDINAFITQHSEKKGDFFFSVVDGLVNRVASGNSLEASYAFGKMIDDGETRRIAGNENILTFKFTVLTVV